jgi:hypothetical protein
VSEPVEPQRGVGAVAIGAIELLDGNAGGESLDHPDGLAGYALEGDVQRAEDRTGLHLSENGADGGPDRVLSDPELDVERLRPMHELDHVRGPLGEPELSAGGERLERGATLLLDRERDRDRFPLLERPAYSRSVRTPPTEPR